MCKNDVFGTRKQTLTHSRRKIKICHEYDRKYNIEVQHAKNSIVLLRKQQKYKTSVKMKGVFEQ